MIQVFRFPGLSGRLRGGSNSAAGFAAFRMGLRVPTICRASRAARILQPVTGAS
jgi:hypothetical protein